LLIVITHNWNKPRDDFNQRVVLGLEVRFLLSKHLDPGIDEEGTEDINDPVEAINEGSADEDHRQAHEQSSHYPPKKNAMLKFRRDLEVRKEK
jgi:hypothetical protein